MHLSDQARQHIKIVTPQPICYKKDLGQVFTAMPDDPKLVVQLLEARP